MPRQPIPTKQTSDSWAVIESGIIDILGRRQSQLKLTTIHDAVSNLVNSNDTKLRTGLQKILTDHFKKWNQELSKVAGNPLIAKFSGIYDDFDNYCTIIPKMYNLYDRRSDGNSNETLNLIRALFELEILKDNELIKDTKTGIIKEIHDARQQENYDLKNVINLVKMFISFRDRPGSIFNDLYELLLSNTDKFYDDFFKAKFEGTSFQSYLEISSQQFSRESEIMNSIFSKEDTTRRELLLTCLQDLYVSREDLFCSGDEPMISTALINSNIKPLKWLAETYSAYDITVDTLYKTCAQFIKNQMLKLADNFTPQMKANEIQDNIKQLMTITDNLSSPYLIVFAGSKSAKLELDTRIKEAWNDPAFNIEENFCVYLDSQYKSEFKNMSQEEKDQFPSTVARFYSMLSDKKKFSGIYETWMVRRFIKMGLKLADIETPTINAIQRAKSPEFAKSFKDYVKTIQDSQNLETIFKTEMQRRIESGQVKQAKNISFSPLVFDQKHFPLDKNMATVLPPQLQQINDAFCSFYTEKHPNYKLMLIQDVSTVESKFQVPPNASSSQPRTYTILSDIICATIIELVSRKPVRYPELLGTVKESKTLDLYLKRLIQKSCPILKVENKPLESTDGQSENQPKKKQDNVFSLNPNFNSKIQRIVIPPIVNERKKDMVQIIETVNNDKAQSIKAAIVRILKNKTKLPQVELENSVIIDMAPYFKAEIGLIRRMINELEVEAYLTKMVEGDSQVLQYIS